MTQIETCQVEPFVSEVTPQLEDPSSLELFQQQVESYLQRLQEAVCDDLESVFANCCLGYTGPITVASTVIDVAPINSNAAGTFDIAAPNTPLGSHVVSWAPLTDATSIEDLMITVFVPEDFVIRVNMQNPTPGVIDPAPIVFQIVLAQAENTLARSF